MRKSKRVAAKREVARNKEEEAVLVYYRYLSRWEKNAFHLLLQSSALGGMTEKTDHYPWARVQRMLGLPAPRKEVAHEA